MKNTFYFLLLIILSFTLKVSAQMTVITGQTATQLVNRLVGPGVVVTNPTLSCPSSANGAFSNAMVTTVAMDSGIVLTTGSALNVSQPASFYSSVNSTAGSGGDANLQAAASGTIYDLCKLEFDFVPVGDTVKFNYRFGSEEYPGYTCSSFNDIFSFFISGPGYAVPKNVALIPGTNCPVSINTVNGSNSNPCGSVGSPCAPPNNALFINAASVNDVAYSGITQKLTAIAAVTPCSTYHMKFAIADVFDDILDSGVFLEANSFISEAATINNVVSSNNLGGLNPFTIEGCNAAVVSLSRPFAKPFAQNITLSYGGVATNGVDYVTPPTVVTIPANATTVTFSINSITDAIIEGTETVKVYVYGALCNTSITDSVTIDILEYPTFNFNGSDTICQGQSVSLLATPIPVNPNLTFTWNSSSAGLIGAGNSISLTPSSTSTYTVSSTYPGCPNVDSIFTIDVENTPSISLTSTDISCNGLADGIINANGAVTFGPAQFSILPSGLTQIGSPSNFTSLGLGTYTVTISSSAGCTNSSSAIISQPPSMTWAIVSSTNLQCAQPTSGAIQVVATGGTNPITYSINPNVGTAINGNFGALTLGTYTITASDANSCSISTVVTLTQPVGPQFNSTASLPVACFGDSNGSVLVNATGVSGSVTYQLLPNLTSNTSGQFSNLSSATYTIIASDASVCTSSATILVASPSPMVWDSILSTQITCNGIQNGIIQVGASGGVGTINYQLNSSGSTNTSGLFNNLGPLNYIVSAVDSNACQITTSIAITQPAVLQITNISSTTPSCLPGNDATLTINSTGGTLPYTYKVNGSVYPSNVVTSLAVGLYTIIVTDANGCTNSQTHTIIAPILPTINAINTTPASCVPGCDGTATVNVTPGSSSVFTYSSNNLNYQSSATLGSLCVLTYTISVKDGNNCTASSTVNIIGLNSPSIASATSTNVTCYGLSNGLINVNAIGGIGSLTYNLLPVNVANFSGNFSNLGNGTYTVLVSDANNCTASTSLLIVEPTQLLIDSLVSVNVTCNNANNGSIAVFASGGTGLLVISSNPISNFIAPNTFSSLVGNTNYLITVTDSNNCVATTNQFITQPSALSIVNSSFTNITCHNLNNGSINVSATGGTGQLVYQLQPSGIVNNNGSFINLAGGTYTVTISDANNCSTNTTISIINPPALSQTLFTSTNITCNNLNNGIINFNVSGGTGSILYTLNPSGISNNTGLFQNLNAGTYTIIASDANSCSITAVATITNPLPIVMNSITGSTLLCANDTNGIISSSASGGIGALTYTLNPLNISNTNGQFNNLIAGNYFVLVTDANGCTTNNPVTITAPPILTSSLSNVQQITCNGFNNGALQVSATGGTGAFTFNLLPIGSQNSTGQFSNLATGNYSVVVNDSNGCVTTVNSIIIQNPAPLILGNITTTMIQCNGDSNGSIILQANGGIGSLNYSINPNVGIQNPNGTFLNLIANSYTVLVTDANGCTISTSIVVNQNNALAISTIQSISPTCYNTPNGQIAIISSGGIMPYTYLLNNSTNNTSGIFQNLTGGNYLLSIIDATGCRKDSIFIMNSPAEINVSSLTLSPVLCANLPTGSIQVAASGGNGSFSYLLTPSTNLNTTGLFENLQNGLYTINITDITGCKIDTVVELQAPVPFVATILSKDITCYGFGNDASAEVKIIGGVPPYQVLWSTVPPQSTTLIDSLEAGAYWVTITDDNGCKLKDSIVIPPGTCCQQVFIPNVFTPNGDGKNETFKMITSAGLQIIQFEVYNRWGNSVWATRNRMDTWDGKINGSDAGMDTYFYILRYTCIEDNKDYLLKGDFLLLR